MSSPPSYYSSFLDVDGLKRRPGLKNVSDFISAGPSCCCFDVQVTHILKSGELQSPPLTCQSKEDLKLAIGLSAPKDRISTLVCAEDLTKDVIEALGSIFSIEPEFFALHLRENAAFRKGFWAYPTSPELDMLPSYLRDAPFYSLLFRRPYEFPGGFKELVNIRQDPSRTHVSRRAMRITGLPTAFVCERVSVYTRKDHGGIDYGIIVTDRLLKPDKPRETVDSVAFYEEPDTLDRTIQCSTRTKLLLWLHGLASNSRQNLLSQDEPVFLRPLIKFTERMSSAYLAYAYFHLNRIVQGHFDASFSATFEFSLLLYRNFHRQIHDQLRILQRTIGMAAIKGVADKAMKQQEEDIKILGEQMQRLLSRLEQDVQILHSTFAVQQAALTSRVAKLAFLFLPLSAVAAILALNGNSRFVIFGAISVPFIMLACLLMYYTKDFIHPDTNKFY